MSKLINQYDWMDDAEYCWGWADQAKDLMNEIGPTAKENELDAFKSKVREIIR